MPEGIDAVLELFPGDSRTDDFKAALGALEVTNMGTLASALVKGSAAVAQASELAGSKATLEAQLAGALIPPGENATPEERSAFKKKLGVPSEISEYGLTALEGTENGKAVLGAYIKAGIPKEAAKLLYEESVALDTAAGSQRETQRQADFNQALASQGENAAIFHRAGAEALYPGENNAAVRERILKDPSLVSGLVLAGRASRENPKQFINESRGGVASKPYPSMDQRGYR